MGRIGRTIKTFVDKLSGSGALARFISAEEVKGDQRTSQVFGPMNEDFAPPDNCKVLNIPVGGYNKSLLLSIAYNNEAIEPKAKSGERRLFSTDQSGAVVQAEIYLQQDGTITIINQACNITISETGDITMAASQSIDAEAPTITAHNDSASITVNPDGSIDISGNGEVSVNSAAKITATAPSIEVNGSSDNLVMWQVLNAQLQAFVQAYNGHGHGPNTFPPSNQASVDITGARANTIKTDG